jgi:hypothetical protein
MKIKKTDANSKNSVSKKVALHVTTIIAAPVVGMVCITNA